MTSRPQFLLKYSFLFINIYNSFVLALLTIVDLGDRLHACSQGRRHIILHTKTQFWIYEHIYYLYWNSNEEDESIPVVLRTFWSMHVVVSLLIPPILCKTIPLVSLVVSLIKGLFYCNSKLSLNSRSMNMMMVLLIQMTLIRRWNIGILMVALVIAVCGMAFLGRLQQVM